MPTTSDYLMQLQTDLTNLKAKYISKGLNIPNNATFTDLVTEFDNLPSSDGDVADYFNTTIHNSDYSNGAKFYKAIIKKIPEITIDDDVTQLGSFFQNLQNPIKLKGGRNITYIERGFSGGTFTSIDFSEFQGNSLCGIYNMFSGCINVETLDLKTFLTCTSASNMFDGCTSLREIDISNLEFSGSGGNINGMFRNCTSLQKIDMRKFTFDTVGSHVSVFDNIPSNCLIIVKSQTEKSWILTQRSDLANVKTVEEYESELNNVN